MPQQTLLYVLKYKANQCQPLINICLKFSAIKKALNRYMKYLLRAFLLSFISQDCLSKMALTG